MYLYQSKLYDSRSPPPSSSSVDRVLSLCAHHLSVRSEAEQHFRAVCRALVSEAVELSFFLEKAKSHESEHSEELLNLALKDWVRFF